MGFNMPATARLSTIQLQVSDLERSVLFYTSLFGFEAQSRTSNRVELRAPEGAEPLIELVEHSLGRKVSPQGQLGLFHLAILLPERRDLAHFLRHAREVGVPMGMSDHLVSEALYFSDPDGLGIEVYADKNRSSWSWDNGQLTMATQPLNLSDLLSEQNMGPFQGVPSATQMGHVHLRVGNLDDAARFYHQGLGLAKTVWNYPGALFLSFGGYHHHVGLNTWAPRAQPPQQDEAQMLSWKLTLPSQSFLDDLISNLLDLGFAVEKGELETLVRDPWGTTLLLSL